MVAVGWLVTATVTTQDLNGLSRHDEEWGLFLATTGDRYLATSGDFFMATDTRGACRMNVPYALSAPG